MSDVLGAGRLEDRPFPALAGQIFRENLSGELTVESGERRRTVWFLGGNPVAIVSEDPRDHLAQFLLEHGRITEEDAARLAGMPETRDGVAAADFVPKDVLNWGVKFRFVNLCYDLFHWEEGDFAFREGNPPRELFLLKVPAHTLIFKGVGYVPRTTLLEAVPDEAVIAAGSVAPAEARYVGPNERELLDKCQPGITVGAIVHADEEREDQVRQTIYAFECLGLVSLPHSGSRPAAPQPEVGDIGFVLDEPEELPAPPTAAAPLDIGDFSAGHASAQPEEDFRLPALNAPPEGTSRSVLDLDLSAATAPLPDLRFDDQSQGASLGSFAAAFPPEESAHEPFAAPRTAAAPARKAPRQARSFNLPRVAGVALGILVAVGLGGAVWWWMIAEEPRPPARQPVPSSVPAPAPVKSPPPATPQATAAGAGAVPPAAPPPSTPPPTAAPTAPPPTAPAAPPPAPAAPPAAPAMPPRAAAPSPGSGADRYRNGLQVFRAGDLDAAATIWEALLAEERRSAFTISLLTACQRETIRDAQQALAQQELYLVSKKVNGRACFRLCAGTYATREEAARALAALPAEYRAAGAAVRPVADVLNR